MYLQNSGLISQDSSHISEEDEEEDDLWDPQHATPFAGKHLRARGGRSNLDWLNSVEVKSL